MNTNQIILDHNINSCKLPIRLHLMLYNCSESYSVSKNDALLFRDNAKVFSPYLKSFKKSRKGLYAGIKTNTKLCNILVTEIYNYRARLRDSKEYSSVRKKYNSIRLKLYSGLIKKQTECQYCSSTDNLSIDHIKPISKGGGNEVSNLQILCRSCNSKKSNKYN